MLRIATIGVLATLFVVKANAQYGTAPNNNYPDTYSGATFTGAVTETDNGQITLTHASEDKTDTFVGRFETGCSVSSKSGRPMMPSDIPPGTELTVFFNRETKHLNGQKDSGNVIIAIAFEIWQGQKVTEDKKRIFWCTKNKNLKFRSWK